MPAGASSGRPIYRVRQFLRAVRASFAPLSPQEQAEVRAWLPRDAWRLFAAMPPADQRHSLNVLWALSKMDAREPVAPALGQAALLHDCAKREGGVRLWHRVAVVLVKAFLPGLPGRWRTAQPPSRGDARYPLWVYLNHPRRGAELAAAAGCDPIAVALILHHQDAPHPGAGDARVDRLLAALQAADDDN